MVSARGGKDPVVTGNRRAHAELMKEQRTKRSKKPRLKIEMKERLRFSPFVPAQEVKEGVAPKMMNHPGRDKYVTGVFPGKGISMQKAARQTLGRCEAVGFSDQGRVEIHPHHFDVVIRERNLRGEPARGVADAAP
jgi:hypothetical protein